MFNNTIYVACYTITTKALHRLDNNYKVKYTGCYSYPCQSYVIVSISSVKRAVGKLCFKALTIFLRDPLSNEYLVGV